MRRLTSLVAVLLLLLTAAPVMACVTDRAMSHMESTCCQAMHNDCGEMAKTGCCSTEIPSQNHPQAATQSAAQDIHWMAMPVQVELLPVVTPDSGFTALLSPEEAPPPLPESTRPTVLRI